MDMLVDNDGYMMMIIITFCNYSEKEKISLTVFLYQWASPIRNLCTLAKCLMVSKPLSLRRKYTWTRTVRSAGTRFHHIGAGTPSQQEHFARDILRLTFQVGQPVVKRGRIPLKGKQERQAKVHYNACYNL